MVAAGLVLGVATVVLVAGWGAGVDALVRLRPEFAAMVPSTAICFALCSGVLLARGAGRRGIRFARGAAAVVAFVAGCDLLLLATGRASGIDGLVLTEATLAQNDAMAFATAFDFLLAALCLATRDLPGRPARWAYRIAATLGLVSAGTAVLGYAFDADALYAVFAFTAMALHTGLAFFALFAAFLLARSEDGWVGLMLAHGSGSAGARRLFPAVVLGNLALCLAALEATEAGLFEANFRLSLLAMAMMALSTVALLRNAAIENAAEARLRAALAEVEAVSRDKDLLLREVNHRVKNNLQQINAMIAMERRRNEDAQARASLVALSERVHALGLVHQKLTGGLRASEVEIGGFLDALAADLRAAYDLDARGITLEIEVADERLYLDVAISLGLLVNELLVNAVKHAFPQGRSGRVRVGFGRDGNGDYVFDVSDDGVGLPEGAQGGVGGRIVDMLLRQLGARASTTTDGGTRWRIVVPAAVNDEGRYV